jgi:phage-related protein
MERKFIDLRITAISDEDLKDFLIALRKIQYCGDVGANRLLPIQIDGDGSGGINIEMHEKEIGGVKLKNLREIVNLDENKTKNVDDSHDFETHYIGE